MVDVNVTPPPLCTHRGDRVTPPQNARYHNNSGEIDMILKEDMEDSEDEEIEVHSSTPRVS